MDSKGVKTVPRISIVTPVYNAQHTLERCARSVLSQTYSDYEWLLVDDGSTDAGAAMCDAYAERYAQIRVVHRTNGGVSSARNDGMAMAQGEYILFLDSDDFLDENMLEHYAAATDDGDVDVVIGGLTVLKDGVCAETKTPSPQGRFGVEIWEHICLSSEMFGYAGGKMIRASLVSDHGLSFRTDMQSQEDLDFFLSAYRVANTFRLIQYAGYQYAYTPGKRVPPVWDFIANQLKLFDGAQAVTELTPSAKQAVERRVVQLLYACLHDAVERGDFCQTWKRLAAVKGLIPFLKATSLRGEQALVAAQFAKGRHKCIYRYFQIRRPVQKLVRRGR